MKKSKIHMKPALPIETDRLLLRKYKDTDVKDLIEYSADPVIAEDIDWEPTEDGIKKFMAKQRDVSPDEDSKWLDLAIELKEEGKVIGTIGIGVLSREHKQGIVGWALGVAYQRHGYATEAARAILEFGFKFLKFHRIIAKSDAKNTRSWLLMERIGMRREAYFRHSKFQKNEWRDKLVYAILSDEWNTP